MDTSVSRGQSPQSPVSALRASRGLSPVFHPIEEDYNKKIKEAMKNENQNDLINLMFELKVLRLSVLKQGKKKSK